MVVTPQMFGGNLDNYHNFKNNYLIASRGISLASLYINPDYKNTDLVELNKQVESIKKSFVLEFED